MQIEKFPNSQFYKSPQILLAINPSLLLAEDEKCKKRTKTVCTIGPKCQTQESAGRLIDEGMSVARLNFSHGDHQSQRVQMVAVQEAAKCRKECHVSILLDTKGPQIRTGKNATEDLIQLKAGQFLQITTDYTHLGTSSRISCSYKELPNSVVVGSKILIADGGISTKVAKIQDNIVSVQVLNNGKIGSKKNMCLPGAVIDLPTIGPIDEKDIIQFGLKYKVNFIAVSFARYKKDLDNLRKLLIEKDPEHGPYVQIISKIENHQGVYNIDQILEGSDGIMIARGDLGMEVPIQKVVVLQKYLTEKAINAGKIVITATQMLESMQTKPRPTRAQVSDITNSVYDLTDATMTSGETANGQFPTQTVKYMRLISEQAEATCDYKKVFEGRKQYISDKVAVGVISLSFELDCHFIYIQTNQIQFIHRLSTLRPKAYIIVFSDCKNVQGALAADFGVYTFGIDNLSQGTEFLSGLVQNFGYKQQSAIRILRIQMSGNQFLGTKYTQTPLPTKSQQNPKSPQAS